jgi:hypothetical protein
MPVAPRVGRSTQFSECSSPRQTDR